MDSDEICLKILKFCNAYARRVIFWRKEHRQIIRKCLKLVLKTYRIKSSHKKRLTSACAAKASRAKSQDGAYILAERSSTPEASHAKSLDDICLEEPSNTHSFDYVSTPPRPVVNKVYSNSLGISENAFNTLLRLVENDLRKGVTNVRNTIFPAGQLCATLRFLQTGESYKDLASRLNISHSYLVYCVPKVCKAILKNLKDIYLKFPNSIEEWQSIAEQFEYKLQFPLCLGALEVKHIFFTPVSGTDNIILLALADANCKFVYIDVCLNARINVNEVLKNSSLQTVLDNAEEHLPPETVIGHNRVLPYVFLADSDFSLDKHLMTPFTDHKNKTEQIIFNERISRARRVVERSFDMLSSRFRLFQKPINLRSLENIDLITRACCVLHNFLIDDPPQSLEITYSATGPISKTVNQTTPSSFDYIRNEFMEYFNDEGCVEWIDD